MRDIFIFSCYTGLSYVDVCELTPENIRLSFDGNLWIIKKRHKTSVAEHDNQPAGEVHLDKYPDGQPDTCQQNIQPHARHVRGGGGGQLR